MNAETIVAIQKRIAELGSQSALARTMGVSQSAISDIAHERNNHVSRATENKVRSALGLDPLPPRIEVDPCPDCGSVHTGRCHGKPVTLRPVRRRTITRWADAPVSVLAAVIRQRQTI